VGVKYFDSKHDAVITVKTCNVPNAIVGGVQSAVVNALHSSRMDGKRDISNNGLIAVAAD
jgi:hypothetical protein